jgi:hypothetical protein
MAILKFGSIITEGSGSLGGHTIQHSKGGYQLRNKPLPRSGCSADQYSIRSLNPILQAGWQALTPAQRKIWNDWPVTHQIMNAKGDKHALSGHSLWMKYCFLPLSLGYPLYSDPSQYTPGYYGPELVLNGSFSSSLYWVIISHWSIAGGKANYLATGTGYLTQVIQFYLNSWYHIEFDISNTVGVPLWRFNVLGIGPLFAAPYSNFSGLADGHYSIDAKSLYTTNAFSVRGNSIGSSFSIDNLSIKKLP